MGRFKRIQKSHAIAWFLCVSAFCSLPSVYGRKKVAGKSRWNDAEEEGEQQVSLRNPKMMFLPFIKVVIPPEPCGTESNGVRDGTCLARGKCDILRGQRSGDCSKGFGECCKLSANCTASVPRIEVDEYVTTLKTPDPSTSQPCTFKIRKKKDVCQIRLDFKTFSTRSANNDGICEEDRLSISNSVTVPDGFTTCGELRDQHMYLSFGSQDSIDITPRLLNPNSRYEIVVQQIPCLSRRIVPSYCLQYYNKSSDIVKSFDYPTQQQSNQRYTVCVEGTEQSKFITWRPCGLTDAGTGFSRSFQVSSGIVQSPTCETDWVDINGDKRYCGDTFPTMVRANWKPYLLNVNFDERELPNSPFGTNPGFITDPAACSAAGTSSGNILQCMWTPEPSPIYNNGSCHCEFNPALLNVTGIQLPSLLGPPPDLNNVGFCLKYET